MLRAERKYGNGGVDDDANRPRVRIENLSKTFPGTRALDDVSLDIHPGEIHALVGGNGSGKSTLLKILTGVIPGDPGGKLEIGDLSVDPDAILPATSYAAGIRCVHQDLGIFPTMTVAENLALGNRFDTGFGGWIRPRASRRHAEEQIRQFDIPAGPSTQLAELSRAGQTLVAIARALKGHEDPDKGLLILDEPTAALPAHEVGRLLAALKRYAAAGRSILYVSHRLDEILSLSDRVTALRDGRTVGTYPTEELDEDRLIELIVGRRLDSVFPTRTVSVDKQPSVLEVENLKVGPVTDLSFTAAGGEIVGIAGLLGSGRSEVLRAIYGDLKAEAGTVRVSGRDATTMRPGRAVRMGMALVPEDRADSAAFLDLSITANILMPKLRSYWKAFWLRDRRMRTDAESLVSKFLVKTAAESSLLNTLSGGNQQKVIVARWLQDRPRLILLDEPTQGVDVGARAEIYRFVNGAAEEGASVVLVASDLDELAHVADRVIVLRGGRATREVAGDRLNAHTLIREVYGTDIEGSSS